LAHHGCANNGVEIRDNPSSVAPVVSDVFVMTGICMEASRVLSDYTRHKVGQFLARDG
jgi:hypothetical protein